MEVLEGCVNLGVEALMICLRVVLVVLMVLMVLELRGIQTTVRGDTPN